MEASGLLRVTHRVYVWGTSHAVYPCKQLGSVASGLVACEQINLQPAGGSKAAKLPDPDLSTAANILPKSSAAPAHDLGISSTKQARKAALSGSDDDTGPSGPAAGKPLCPMKISSKAWTMLLAVSLRICLQ